jgi:AcrR family transcriptional regulator
VSGHIAARLSKEVRIVDTPERQVPPSLAEEQQLLTRARIRKAAMEVVAQRGFDATVDEIAQVSGVSPRTIFRYYETHDRLIAATVKDMFEACGLPQRVDDLDRWMEDITRVDNDPDDWIDFLAVTFHTRSASIFGAAFWDISAPRHNESTALAEVDALRREYRRKGIGYFVKLVWETAGGVDEPPEDLVLAFALNLSVFTTQALMVDFNQTPAQIGALTADILKVFLWRAVDAQRASGSDGAP